MMKRIKILFILLGLFVIRATVYSQVTTAPESQESVFAPFVSQITAEVMDDTVKLTWRDSPDVEGPVLIFRDTLKIPMPISDYEPLAEVPYGAESYIDEYEGEATLHYLIVSVDSSGHRYGLSIPYGNSITVQVKPAPVLLPEEDTSTEGLLAIDSYQGVMALSAEVQGDAVIISYAPDIPGKGAVLYRSAQLIEEMQDLLEAVIVQADIQSSPFVDYPVPGISYFYALIYEEDLKTGSVQLEAGKNTTIIPVQVPAGRYRIGLPGPRADLRAMPLPLMSIHSAVPNAENTVLIPTTALPLSPEASKAIAAFTHPSEGIVLPEKKLRAFAQDLQTPAGGEEYTLRSIVQGPFVGKDWEAAKEQLSKYLSLPRTAQTEGRARFYLGQAYYFSGQMRDALFQFLLVRNQYPGEASEWIQVVLPRLSSTEEFSKET